ncbi:MAG: metal ABC transporter permease [Aigarchaeota archaeon]|nr:metal ABC transporter permease [Aigarchaeota archaeon]MDW8093294.1 metal ABC transporter permease [Nitrososphaerota archaeon]
MGLIQLLLEPFQYNFMQIALVTSIVVGIVTSILSCFIVIRGWALLGDAISHSVLPGIAIAVALNVPLVIGALVAGIGSSLLIGYTETKFKVRNDTAIGIVLTGAFALGLVILSRLRPTVDIFHVLFGNVLGVTYDELLFTSASASIVLIIVGLFMKEIVVYTFDPIYAKVIGLPASLIHYMLMSLLSLCIVASIQTAGIILVVSLLIAPGATAYMFAGRMSQMFSISLLAGVVSVIIGLYISYYFAVSSGGAIALVATLIFFVSSMVKLLRTSALR